MLPNTYLAEDTQTSSPSINLPWLAHVRLPQDALFFSITMEYDDKSIAKSTETERDW